MVNKRLQKHLSLAAIILFSLISFVSVNLLIGIWFGDDYLDLTPDRRYSLSDKTKEFLKNNQKSLTIRLYQSFDLAQKNPELGQYANYVRKLIHEYQKNSHGLIDVSLIDVRPFHSSQASAETSGIKEFDFGDGNKYLYLGASFTSSDGISEVIPQFVPARKDNIEDDITRILSVLLRSEKIVIGVLSSYFEIPENQNEHLHKKNSLSFIRDLEAKGFEFVPLSEEVPYIPEYVDAVLVFYPLKYDVFGVYALDQYLVRGGKILMFLDSFSEERFRGQDEYVPYNSGVLSLLDKRGITYHENILVGNNEHNRELVLEGKRIKYPFWLSLENKNMSKHFLTEDLRKLYLNHSGFFTYEKNKDLHILPILETDENSGIMGAEYLVNLSYDNLIRSYQADFGKHALAILVEGKFDSVYEEPIISNPELLAQFPLFQMKAEEEGKLLLIADADMMFESLWRDDKASQKDIYGAAYSSDNILFLRRALDYLTDSGYINNSSKKIGHRDNLLDVFTRFSVLAYQQTKEEVWDRLLRIRKSLTELNEKIILNGLSIQLIKQKEELIRQETSLRVEIDKMSYLVKEHYQNMVSGFALALVVLWPLFVGGIIFGVYRLFLHRIRSKIRGILDDA